MFLERFHALLRAHRCCLFSSFFLFFFFFFFSFSLFLFFSFSSYRGSGLRDECGRQVKIDGNWPRRGQSWLSRWNVVEPWLMKLLGAMREFHGNISVFTQEPHMPGAA